MKKSKYIILLSIGFIIAATVSIVFKMCLYAAKRSMVYGNIAAVDEAFFSELNNGNRNLKDILSSSSHQWRFLTSHEYDRIIIELSKSHNLDPPKNWNTSQPLLDPWGNRLEISYRMLEDGNYDTMVISKGPDSIYGTEDDLVSGYGRNPPTKAENEKVDGYLNQ